MLFAVCFYIPACFFITGLYSFDFYPTGAPNPWCLSCSFNIFSLYLVISCLFCVVDIPGFTFSNPVSLIFVPSLLLLPLTFVKVSNTDNYVCLYVEVIFACIFQETPKIITENCEVTFYNIFIAEKNKCKGNVDDIACICTRCDMRKILDKASQLPFPNGP